MPKTHDLNILFPDEISMHREYHLVESDEANLKVACLFNKNAWVVDELSNTLNEELANGRLTLEQVQVFLTDTTSEQKDLH